MADLGPRPTRGVPNTFSPCQTVMCGRSVNHRANFDRFCKIPPFDWRQVAGRTPCVWREDIFLRAARGMMLEPSRWTSPVRNSTSTADHGALN